MLKINDLNVSYGASQVLFGVDLQANWKCCVLGRNGVGKDITGSCGCWASFRDLGTSPLEGEDIRDRDPASSETGGCLRAAGKRNICTTPLSKKTSK